MDMWRKGWIASKAIHAITEVFKELGNSTSAIGPPMYYTRNSTATAAGELSLPCSDRQYVQVLKFGTFDHPITATVSDKHNIITAEFADSCKAIFEPCNERRITSMKGALIQLLRYDIVFRGSDADMFWDGKTYNDQLSAETSEPPPHPSSYPPTRPAASKNSINIETLPIVEATLYIREFKHVGSDGQAPWGSPATLQTVKPLLELLEKIPRKRVIRDGRATGASPAVVIDTQRSTQASEMPGKDADSNTTGVSKTIENNEDDEANGIESIQSQQPGDDSDSFDDLLPLPIATQAYMMNDSQWPSAEIPISSPEAPETSWGRITDSENHKSDPARSESARRSPEEPTPPGTVAPKSDPKDAENHKSDPARSEVAWRSLGEPTPPGTAAPKSNPEDAETKRTGHTTRTEVNVPALEVHKNRALEKGRNAKAVEKRRNTKRQDSRPKVKHPNGQKLNINSGIKASFYATFPLHPGWEGMLEITEEDCIIPEEQKEILNHNDCWYKPSPQCAEPGNALRDPDVCHSPLPSHSSPTPEPAINRESSPSSQPFRWSSSPERAPKQKSTDQPPPDSSNGEQSLPGRWATQPHIASSPPQPLYNSLPPSQLTPQATHNHLSPTNLPSTPRHQDLDEMELCGPGNNSPPSRVTRHAGPARGTGRPRLVPTRGKGWTRGGSAARNPTSKRPRATVTDTGADEETEQANDKKKKRQGSNVRDRRSAGRGRGDSKGKMSENRLASLSGSEYEDKVVTKRARTRQQQRPSRNTVAALPQTMQPPARIPPPGFAIKSAPPIMISSDEESNLSEEDDIPQQPLVPLMMSPSQPVIPNSSGDRSGTATFQVEVTPYQSSDRPWLELRAVAPINSSAKMEVGGYVASSLTHVTATGEEAVEAIQLSLKRRLSPEALGETERRVKGRLRSSGEQLKAEGEDNRPPLPTVSPLPPRLAATLAATDGVHSQSTDDDEDDDIDDYNLYAMPGEERVPRKTQARAIQAPHSKRTSQLVSTPTPTPQLYAGLRARTVNAQAPPSLGIRRSQFFGSLPESRRPWLPANSGPRVKEIREDEREDAGNEDEFYRREDTNMRQFTRKFRELKAVKKEQEKKR